MVKSYIKAIALIIVLFFLVTFGIKNSSSVQISYYFGLFDIDVPLWGIVYASLFFGAVISWLFGLTGRFALKKRLKAAEKEYKEMHAELELLRSKAAVPVYSETIYVPTPKPVQEDSHDVKHIGGAY